MINKIFKELLVFLVLIEVVIMCIAFIWIIVGEYGGQFLMLVNQVMYFFGILLTAASAGSRVRVIIFKWKNESLIFIVIFFNADLSVI